MCKHNSTGAYYKANTKAQIRHKNSTKNKTKQSNKNITLGQTKTKVLGGQKCKTPQKSMDEMIQKCHRLVHNLFSRSSRFPKDTAVFTHG